MSTSSNGMQDTTDPSDPAARATAAALEQAVHPATRVLPKVGPRDFRGALGRFASGVTIVTTRVEDRDYGATVSAFSSVSLDPPLVLCCFQNGTATVGALLERGWFTVCLLEESQIDLARRFASRAGDRFEGVPLARTPYGLPVLEGALAQLICRVNSHVEAGDHTVVFGAVRHIHTRDGDPLVVFRSKFGHFRKEGS